MCDQSDKNVQLPVRPRGLIDVRRKFNLLLHPIVICRLTISHAEADSHPAAPFEMANIIFITKDKRVATMVRYEKSSTSFPSSFHL